MFYGFSEEVGIPIGSPLGSLVAEVFMKLFEHQLISSKHPLLPHVTYWHRYVDDCSCISCILSRVLFYTYGIRVYM